MSQRTLARRDESVAREWLNDAVIYQIYPQSFADSDGDGIGDLPGVIDRLDYLEWLGVNTIWFNPCFESPFADAGYDVSDYLKVAARYGTNDDLERLVREAKQRGIRVLLDLVAGHTSVEHPWFQRELAASGPDPAGDRYVWRHGAPAPPKNDIEMPGTPQWVESPGPRPGWYLKNFYDDQPALNFGWANVRSDEPWRDAVDDAGPIRNREALREIMAFWLDRGVAGFRIDMAFSLVKDDDDLVETLQLWSETKHWLDDHYPDAVFIPEGVEPRATHEPAFDADFFLAIFEPHAALFDNGSAGSLPWTSHNPCYFDDAGRGTVQPFLEAFEQAQEGRPDRRIIVGSADHDFGRLASDRRNGASLESAFVFLLTWGSIPSIWYGDEIGMRYLPDAPDVEGAVCYPTYNRAGCRTPMQWDTSANAGFSSAPADQLYLPIDADPSRPDVASSRDDETSLLHLVRRVIQIRKETPSLHPGTGVEVIGDGYPLAYIRGGDHLVIVNPSSASSTVDLPQSDLPLELISNDVRVADGVIHVGPRGYAIFRLG